MHVFLTDRNFFIFAEHGNLKIPGIAFIYLKGHFYTPDVSRSITWDTRYQFSGLICLNQWFRGMNPSEDIKPYIKRF